MPVILSVAKNLSVEYNSAMLYIVGTPLGNARDISLRAVQTLVSADVILAEDTRSFATFYPIIQELYKLSPAKEQKIVSFYKDNEFERLPSVLESLEDGLDIALISESGMPLISDPGSPLIQYLTTNNIAFTVIPGPTAFVNAAVLSGFKFKSLIHCGFLPKKKSEVLKTLDKILIAAQNMDQPILTFYESPFRINETLTLISKKAPKAQIAICREMTKKFEEVLRGTPQELSKESYRGELTVAIGSL